jgi:hypothetical protein
MNYAVSGEVQIASDSKTLPTYVYGLLNMSTPYKSYNIKHFCHQKLPLKFPRYSQVVLDVVDFCFQ